MIGKSDLDSVSFIKRQEAVRTNGAPSSVSQSNDPTQSPKYHRKRRMVVAATGLVGRVAQIYTRYLSRLWKETNTEARTLSSQKKILTSIRQLNQLLTTQEKKLSITNNSTFNDDAARDALLMARKVQDACQTYLNYETAMADHTKASLILPAIYSDDVAAVSATTIPPIQKVKTRRSIGFGALMGLAVAGMVFSGNYVFTGIFTMMTVLGQLEYYRMVMNTGVLPARRISILGSASMFITALVAPSLHEVCLPIFGLYTMIWFLTMRRTVSTIPEIATTFSGMFYLGYVPSFWVRIRQTGSQLPPSVSLPPWAAPYVTAMTSKIQSFIPAFVLPAIHLPITSGAIFVFWTWLCIAFSDVGGYFVGKSFGKTKLGQISPAAGEASPNKTVEGVLGGCLVSGLLGILGAWAQRWPHFVVTGAAHGVMLALCGLIGDLTASMLKRDAGLKDFGDLLPEHGGIMDRVDSYIWTAPYSWLVLSFVLPALGRSTVIV
jgi:phosphatidate cytidylyltransferase